VLALGKVKMNFFNFVAIPITFGIGVDYAVNVMQRVLNGGGVLPALRLTGGAVVLCSLTTTLGYLALLGSVNQAVRSLGMVAVLGGGLCLCSALLLRPPGWAERAGRGEARAAGAAAAGWCPGGPRSRSGRQWRRVPLLSAVAVAGCSSLFAGVPSGFAGWFHLERPDRATNIQFAQAG